MLAARAPSTVSTTRDRTIDHVVAQPENAQLAARDHAVLAFGELA